MPISISIALAGGSVVVYFQSETEEQLAALDKEFGFEGVPISVFAETPPCSIAPHKEAVAKIGGHEKTRWISIDLAELLEANSYVTTQLAIKLLRLQADVAKVTKVPRCIEENCGGELNEKASLPSIWGYRTAVICSTCGRLYWEDTGEGVVMRDDLPVFFKDNSLFKKDKDGSFFPV